MTHQEEDDRLNKPLGYNLMDIRLKTYDRLLFIKRKLDGTKIVCRKSPFSSRKDHEILTIENKRLGGWVLKKIMTMDTQRFDIIDKAARNNRAIKNKRDDDRTSREVADFFMIGGVIN